MDDRRFDSLARALASGTNRRSLLKTLTGLGTAAVAGGLVTTPHAEAARRGKPPVSPMLICTPPKVPFLGVCTCPLTAPFDCGADCCTGTAGDSYPRPSWHSECCGDTCCYGNCMGDGSCCPTNTVPSGIAGSPEEPPAYKLCEGECIPYDDCCPTSESCGGDCEPDCDCTEEANAGLLCNAGDGFCDPGGWCACFQTGTDQHCTACDDACPAGTHCNVLAPRCCVFNFEPCVTSADCCFAICYEGTCSAGKSPSPGYCLSDINCGPNGSCANGVCQ